MQDSASTQYKSDIALKRRAGAFFDFLPCPVGENPQDNIQVKRLFRAGKAKLSLAHAESFRGSERPDEFIELPNGRRMPLYERDDFVITGRAKNISPETLERVMIKAEFQDEAGNSIDRNGVRIATLPIAPGQESTFELNHYFAPTSIVGATIHFETFSGQPIPTRDSRD